jgi:hypothetical protein
MRESTPGTSGRIVIHSAHIYSILCSWFIISKSLTVILLGKSQSVLLQNTEHNLAIYSSNYCPIPVRILAIYQNDVGFGDL